MSEKPAGLLTRRQVLAGAGALALAAAGCGTSSTDSAFTPIGQASTPAASPTPVPSPTPSVAAFVQPPTRASVNGLLDTAMHVQMATQTVNGQSVTTRTYEGMFGGPTLRVKPGDTLRFNVVNQLPANPDQNTDYPDMDTPHHFNSTNNHTHGLHVSPMGNSDNIFVEVAPSESFQYQYQIPSTHNAGTFFYHPHKHGAASEQMFGGMGGMLIIEGDIDQVPEIAAARDLVFLINELNIDPSTGMCPTFLPPLPNPLTDEFPLENRTILVNGQVNPTLTCQPGEVVRLRVLAAGPETFYPLSIDGHSLNLIALDGITLSSVQQVDSVSLAAANRADILLQAGSPGTYSIHKGANSVTFDNDPDVVIATLVITGEPLNMQLPTTLPAPFTDIQSSEITGTRQLTFFINIVGGPPGPPSQPVPSYLDFSINGLRFDPNVVNQTINLGAVEEWTLVNGSASGHPFHIHINPFQVISVNGTALPQPEWHDTIMIPAATQDGGPGTVVIRSRFQDFKGMYVLHCHILVHEDLGMMQIVNVI